MFSQPLPPTMQTLVRRRVDAKDAAADVPAVALLAVLLQASLMNWRVGGTKAHADEWLRAIYVHNMLQGDGFMVGLLFMLTCLLLWAAVSSVLEFINSPGVIDRRRISMRMMMMMKAEPQKINQTTTRYM